MRINLSKHQRYASLAAAAIILVVLWLQIQDEGFSGYGWVLALLVAAVLVILGIGPVGTTTPAEPAAPAHVRPTKEELEAGWQKLRENGEILAIEVEERAKAISAGFISSRLRTDNEAIDKGMDAFQRERALLFSLGLVGIRRAEDKHLYVTGLEYKTVEKTVFDSIARESIAASMAMGLPVDKDKLLPQLLGELQAVRKTIVQAAEARKRGDTDVAMPLVEWLAAQGMTLRDDNVIKTALKTSADA
ncbi:hypothetical protein ACC668_10605 [Rhizobium ruizarguesonis]